MSALKTRVFEFGDGGRAYRVEAGLVRDHFHVRALSGGDLVALDWLTVELSTISDPARPYVEALIAVNDCTIDGIPRVRNFGGQGDPHAALRASISAALCPNGSDEALAHQLRHALPRDTVKLHRATAARRIEGILALDDRKPRIIELLLRLEESADHANDSFKSQFSLFTGANVRKMKSQIGAIAAEFAGDFEYLGFPQVDVSTEGSRSGLARKCDLVKNRAAAVSAAYRLGPGSLPYAAFETSVAEAVALTIADEQILEPALRVWSERAALAREILGVSAGENEDPVGANDTVSPVATQPVPRQTTEPGEVGAGGPSGVGGDRAATTSDEAMFAFVQRRLGENIAALLEAAVEGRSLSSSDGEDLDCALEFLTARHPEIKPALERMRSMSTAATPARAA